MSSLSSHFTTHQLKPLSYLLSLLFSSIIFPHSIVFSTIPPQREFSSQQLLFVNGPSSAALRGLSFTSCSSRARPSSTGLHHTFDNTYLKKNQVTSTGDGGSSAELTWPVRRRRRRQRRSHAGRGDQGNNATLNLTIHPATAEALVPYNYPYLSAALTGISQSRRDAAPAALTDAVVQLTRPPTQFIPIFLIYPGT